jgi:hypothetical protein
MRALGQFSAFESFIFNQAFTIRLVEAAGKLDFKRTTLGLPPQTRNNSQGGRAWVMSNVRKIFCLSLECNLFNQIAMFSSVGLSASLALVLSCDLRIENWI